MVVFIHYGIMGIEASGGNLVRSGWLRELKEVTPGWYHEYVSQTWKGQDEKTRNHHEGKLRQATLWEVSSRC